MGETLTKDKDSEDISLENAQKVSDKLKNLREEKRERVREEIKKSDDSSSTDTKHTKTGTVKEIEIKEEHVHQDQVKIDVEYVENGDTNTESFQFKIPRNEEDIHVDNRLIRFIHFVGDGSMVDLNKVMYRDVPLIIGKDGSAELDIPDVGKFASAKHTVNRYSVDISSKLKKKGVSMEAETALFGISSLVCLIVGFLALQVSLDAGSAISEQSFDVLASGLVFSAFMAIPIGGISVFMGFLASGITGSNSWGDYAFSTSFVLSFLIFGVLSVTNGVGLESESLYEMAKYSSGSALPLLSLVSGYIFLSKSNTITYAKKKYGQISKRLKLRKGPEFLK